MYAKVFRSLWDGTLAEPWQGWAVLVFLLAHQDREGFVDMHPSAIARRSGLPLVDVETGLRILTSPDPQSRTPGEDGRRLVPINADRPWGWRIVNSEQYRALASEEARRERWRRGSAAYRGRLASPLQESAGRHPESAHVEGEGDGEAENPNTSGAEPEGGAPPESRRNAARTPSRGLGEVVMGSEREAAYGTIPGLPLVHPDQWWRASQDFVDELQRLYPPLDVSQELRSMRAWLIANPERRKTARGMPRFVTGWLSRSQNTGRGSGQRTTVRAESDSAYRAANRGRVRS